MNKLSIEIYLFKLRLDNIFLVFSVLVSSIVFDRFFFIIKLLDILYC